MPSIGAVVLILVGSMLLGSGFVGAPVTLTRCQQAVRLRKPVRAAARSSTSAPEHTLKTQESDRGAFRRKTATPEMVGALRIAATDLDSNEHFNSKNMETDKTDQLQLSVDIDPLEAGPDAPTKETRKKRKVVAKEKNSAPMTRTAGSRAKKTPKKRRERKAVERPPDDSVNIDSTDIEYAMRAAQGIHFPNRRKRINPYAQREQPPPIQWMQTVNLEHGCRGILVVCHRGLEEDQAVAAKLFGRVRDRFGPRVALRETTVEHEDMTREELVESNAFEVWLQSVECIPYHLRAQTDMELTDEFIQNILDDLETRVSDEAINGFDMSPVPSFRVPGIPLEEAIKRAHVLL